VKGQEAMLPTNATDLNLLASLLMLVLASVVGVSVMLLVLGHMPPAAARGAALPQRGGMPRLLGVLTGIAFVFAGVVLFQFFSLLR
jgi:hypothetical protein